jgi:hypothetical protein
MYKLSKKILEHFDLEGDWDEMIFTGHNPTSSDVNFNFFDLLITQQTNVPNTPYGYVQPPALVSSTITPPPSILNYPTIDTLGTYPFFVRNNTLKYDSVHSRMYMTYYAVPRLTWQDSTNNFYSSSILLVGMADVIDTAISTTSNKLILISTIGNIIIVDTTTNTIIANFLSPASPDAHRQVEWNSVKNTWYITSINGNIIEVDCVTNAVVSFFNVGAGKRPYGLTFKASTNEMFVTYDTNNEIASINCTTNVASVIIANTITTNPRVIFYNPTTDIVTYGSNISLGVRSFNATTLVFESSVINLDILHIGYYPLDNKLYLLPASSNVITILDGNNLSIANSVTSNTPSITSAAAFCQIEFYPPNNQMLYNINVLFPVTKSNLVGVISLAPPNFWIDGSVEYNDTVRDFFNSPAWVRRIYFYSKTKENLYQVIQHIYKDANGIECNFPRIPSLSIGINQFQDWIGELDFPTNECIFGINQWFQNVLVKSNSELGMLLIYKQIEKVKLLGGSTGNLGKTICDEYASCPNKLRKWSERDLYLNDYSVVTPFKQNMFLGLKEDAVKPFDFSMLKTYEIEEGCKGKCDI